MTDPHLPENEQTTDPTEGTGKGEWGTEAEPVLEGAVAPDPETEAESAPVAVEAEPMAAIQATVEADAEGTGNEQPDAEEPTPQPANEPTNQPTNDSSPNRRTAEPPKTNEPTFASLGLPDAQVAAIAALGFETPTPIQARAIPVMMRGGDFIGQAQTGTGKTAAFALPIIARVDPADRATQAIVLAPTRELAVQVAGGIHDLAKHLGLRVVPVYGGQPIDRQFRALQAGAQIVVGTPGRVLDHLRRGSLSLANVKVAVLDEADEMLALGFAEDMEAILAELPDERQLAFFSATMPPRVLQLTKRFLKEPEHVKIESKRRTLETTNQTYYEVPPGKKKDALVRVLDMETPGPTIVFCRTRQETQELSEALALQGYNAEPLHGDMNQSERDRVLRRFREGLSDLLVATDVAARGLDIDTVTHVVNYDIPWDVEQYIHRIGRTGRAGRTGDAITLVTGRERFQLRNIERMIGSQIRPARLPTAADIAARRRETFTQTLREALEARQFDGHLSTVHALLDGFDATEIAAAALTLLWQSQHSAPAESAEELAQEGARPEAGMTRLFVGIGRADGLRPGDLVGAITNEAGLEGKQIGAIDILDRTAFVEVPSDRAEDVINALSNTMLRRKRVKVAIARPMAPGDTPQREERGPRKSYPPKGDRPAGPGYGPPRRRFDRP